jgi:hypothetical protein
MRPFRTIVIITGILVAGLALNTTFGQEIIKAKKADNPALKAKIEKSEKVHARHLHKISKIDRKLERKDVVKKELKKDKVRHKHPERKIAKASVKSKKAGLKKVKKATS